MTRVTNTKLGRIKILGEADLEPLYFTFTEANGAIRRPTADEWQWIKSLSKLLESMLNLEPGESIEFEMEK